MGSCCLYIGKNSVLTVLELVTDASSLKTTNKFYILKGMLIINMFYTAGIEVDLCRKFLKVRCQNQCRVVLVH